MVRNASAHCFLSLLFFFIQERIESNVPTTQDSDDEMIEHFDRLAATNIKRTTNISGIDCDLGLDYDWSISHYDVSCYILKTF